MTATAGSTPAPHQPVMLAEAMEALAVRPGGRYVDATTGAGGHAEAILDRAVPGGRLLALDADRSALEVAAERLSRFGEAVTFVHGNFRDLAALCEEHGFVPVDGVLFDLGVSSMQLTRRDAAFRSAGTSRWTCAWTAAGT